MTMADQIAVMNEGRIEQLGGPTDLYERPATAFVAGFLGISNLIAGRLDGTDVVTADGTRLAVAHGAADGRTGPVRLGIRPEKIRVAEGEAPVGASLTGTVREYAYVGVATQYVVETPAGEIQVFHQNATPGVQVAQPGTQVTLAWDPQATFLVEGETP